MIGTYTNRIIDERRVLAQLYHRPPQLAMVNILHRERQLHHLRLGVRNTRNLQQQRSPLQGSRSQLAGPNCPPHPITIRRDSLETPSLRSRRRKFLLGQRQQHMRCPLDNRNLGWTTRNGAANQRQQCLQCTDAAVD